MEATKGAKINRDDPPGMHLRVHGMTKVWLNPLKLKDKETTEDQHGNIESFLREAEKEPSFYSGFNVTGAHHALP